MRPGSRHVSGIAAAIVCVAAAVSLGLVVAPGGPSTQNGGIPSWLPKATVPVGRIVTATAAHPWLAIEGDSVLVKLHRGTSLVTAVGPAVPAQGQFPIPATSPCTFTLTFAKTSGVVPIRADAFSITDQYGHLYQPTMSVQGAGVRGGEAAQGHVLTLTLTTVLPTGSGTLRWTPSGSRAVVAWDFNVEVD